MTWQDRFDRILKAMSEGEKPTGRRESEGSAIAEQRADREGRRNK